MVMQYLNGSRLLLLASTGTDIVYLAVIPKLGFYPKMRATQFTKEKNEKKLKNTNILLHDIIEVAKVATISMGSSIR